MVHHLPEMTLQMMKVLRIVEHRILMTEKRVMLLRLKHEVVEKRSKSQTVAQALQRQESQVKRIKWKKKKKLNR